MIDIGINLSHDSFDPDRDQLITEAKALGIRHLVMTGTSLQQQEHLHELTRRYQGYVSQTAGVHPHHAIELWDPTSPQRKNQQAIAQLTAWALTPAVVAVGECGLDYFRMFQEKNVQSQCFERHIEISLEVNKPLFCHVRDAHIDFMAIVKAAGRPLKLVVHCFTGTEAELEDYLSMGFYIGITGWVCDERRGQHILNYLSKIPDDRLMIETDAPYLLPRTIRPKPKDRRNEPKYLAEVAQVVAQARGQTLEKLSAITHNTAVEFFGLSVPWC